MSYAVPSSTASLSTYGWEATPVPSIQYHGPPPVSHEQQTDQETVSALWRFFAACSSHLVLLGFLVLPMAFGAGEKANTHADKTSTIIAASVLIVTGYMISLMLVCFQSHVRTYLLNSLFLYAPPLFSQLQPLKSNPFYRPCLTTNILSLINVLLNILCRNLQPLGTLEAASLGLPSAFAFLYAMGALWTCITVEPRGCDNGSPLLTEEEMQRQQLQRLLDKNSSKGLSPKMAQKTFRVEGPERIHPGKGWDTFTPPPRRDDSYFGR
ncbi:hypothetical protein BO71DRAFT_320136 [Aspergillus ellipticus CBS 707.79]|uniref:Uncharacterized protein n=1 Tax=Aspergillus ellipticus CBS 707.79 TaxID=1448320 RepID=A0A319DRH6_9EURO|nr:hypothetical protein BO71DRAFT_320136 [Aspergillus ellipticus CBS 707.79]